MALISASTVLAGASKSIITAADSNGNIAPAHVLVNSSGVEVGNTVNPLSVSSDLIRSQCQCGPMTTTSYSYGYYLSGLIELTNMARSPNGTGKIIQATLSVNAVNQHGAYLMLFSSQPASNYISGAANQISALDFPILGNVIDLKLGVGIGSNASISDSGEISINYRCDALAKSTSLWAVVVAKDTFTLNFVSDATLTVWATRN